MSSSFVTWTLLVGVVQPEGDLRKQLLALLPQLESLLADIEDACRECARLALLEHHLQLASQ